MMNDQTTGTVTISLITIILLTLSAVVAATPVAAQENGELTLEETSVSVPQGEEETIAVVYNGNVEPAGLQYDISYDSDVINVEDHTVSNDFDTDFDFSETTEGRTSFDVVFSESVDKSSGTVSLITIKPARGAEAGATTSLSFDDNETIGTYADGTGEIELTTTDGTVQVEEGTTIADRVAGLTDPANELDFDDLNTAIQRYQNDEPVDGATLTFDDLIYVIEQHHQ